MVYQYATAVVCKNGHVVTGDMHSGDATKFCQKCGEETVSSCAECDAPIRGDGHDTEGGTTFPFGSEPPSFCYNCGKPYEWTVRQIQAAKDLADEIDDIDPLELAKAKESFIALGSDTPQTPVAVARISKLLKKAGPVIGGGIRDVIVSIATEAVKKQLGL